MVVSAPHHNSPVLSIALPRIVAISEPWAEGATINPGKLSHPSKEE
jgi:hypothetical protein